MLAHCNRVAHPTFLSCHCCLPSLQSGLAPIHYAAWQGHATVLKALLAAGVRVNTPDAVSMGPGWLRVGQAT